MKLSGLIFNAVIRVTVYGLDGFNVVRAPQRRHHARACVLRRLADICSSYILLTPWRRGHGGTGARGHGGHRRRGRPAYTRRRPPPHCASSRTLARTAPSKPADAEGGSTRSVVVGPPFKYNGTTALRAALLGGPAYVCR